MTKAIRFSTRSEEPTSISKRTQMNKP